MQHFQVVVVGAGPSGAVAAIDLKQKNMQVALVDKADFPRDKICGDGMPLKTIRLLEELGFTEAQLFEKGFHIKGMVVYSPQGYQTPLGGLTGSSASKSGCIPRKYFDALLFRKAQQMADKTFNGWRLQKLIRHNAHWMLILKNTQNSTETRISADLVIGADGAYSQVARDARLLQEDRSQTYDGMRLYYLGEHFEPLVHIFYDARLLPGYLWIFPVSRQVVNVGLMIKRKKGKPISALFNEVLESNELVKNILKNARPLNTAQGALLPLGSIPGERISDAVILIGDAAAFINPLTGGGIYNGILSARQAASVAASAFERGDFSKQSLSAYENWWRRELLPGFEYAAWLQKKMATERFAKRFLRKTAHNRYYARFFFLLYGRSLPKHRLLNPLFWLRVFTG